jgi:PleD family two-component response regulator
VRAGTPERPAALRTTQTAGIMRPVRGRIILVAEDDAVNRMLIEIMLRDRGYEVVLAADGQEALERLSQQRVDAVLMDCQMPVMDGFGPHPRG